MSKQFDCIVIGGGHNGLTSACWLAKRGRKVAVVESRSRCGGLAAGTEFHPGYSTAGLLHDTTGVRQWVVKNLDLAQHGLKFKEGRPAIFAATKSGAGILLHEDAHQAANEIAAYSEKDAKAYADYRKFIQRIKPFLSKIFDDHPPDVYAMNFYGLMDLMGKAVTLRLLGRADMMEILRIGPMCVADWLSEWFETELLKATLAGPAIYGSWTGPWSPSTNANLIQHETMSNNTVEGGPKALTEALLKACSANGVEIITGSKVERIDIENAQVKGVTLKNGEQLEAKIVSSSLDPKQTFLNLVPNHHMPSLLEERVVNYRSRGTTAKLHLALKGPLKFACRPDYTAEYARTGETLDDLERAFDAVKYRDFSVEPALDIYQPTVSDPSLAPGGGAVLSVMINFASYNLDGGWTDEQRGRLQEATLAVLETYAPNIRQQIVGSELLTPVDLENQFGLSGGHIFHGEHAADQIITRPTPECSKYNTPIEGLYLSGSGSHPGGGITCAPGALSAAAILKS